MDFVYLLRVLSKRKWIIIGSALMAALVAWFLTRNEKKQYRSVSQVSTGFTNNDIVKLNDDNDFFQTDTKFNNAVVTFTSPTVISLLSYKAMLHDLEHPTQPFRKLNEQQKESPVFTGINTLQAERLLGNKLDSMSILTSYKPDEKKLLEFLKLYGYDYNSISQDLSVYRVERTDYIQLNYTSENPELSAFMVNTIFQEFVRYYRSIRSERNAESIDTLKSVMKQKLEQRQEKNNAVLNTGGVTSEVSNTSGTDQLTDLRSKLLDAKDKQTSTKIALDQVKSRLASLGVDQPSVNTSNADIVALRNQMNDANTAYMQSGSTDQNALNRYNKLRAQYLAKLHDLNSSSSANSTSADDRQQLMDKRDNLEVDYQSSTALIASINAEISQVEGQIQTQDNRNAQAQTLSKDADLADKEYETVQEKVSDALNFNNASINNFHQILIGQPAIEPEPSKRMLIVAMAGLAVLILSILVIVFLTYLDSSIKTPSIFSRTVNLKLLSMVNFMDLKDKMLANVVANTSMAETADEKSRNNVFRESLRKLRYEIENSGKKVFLFTSTKKGEGKTTLIQALAYSFSLSKKKVLIIDTNFSNNDLTVQLSGTPMLEKIVAEDKSERVITDVVNAAVSVNGGTVYVLGCSGGDYTPSEILPAKHVLLHLQQLTQVYDYLFLEGPPLNDYSDSKELVQYVDGVVAIFSARHIIKQIDKESIGFFKNLNGKFCGSVLNMVEMENLNDV